MTHSGGGSGGLSCIVFWKGLIGDETSYTFKMGDETSYTFKSITSFTFIVLIYC